MDREQDTAIGRFRLFSLPIRKRSTVMSVSVRVRVCVCVCGCVRARSSVHSHIFGTARSIFSKICVLITYGRGSVLNVAAQLKRSAHAALGLAINCAQ